MISRQPSFSVLVKVTDSHTTCPGVTVTVCTRLGVTVQLTPGFVSVMVYSPGVKLLSGRVTFGAPVSLNLTTTGMVSSGPVTVMMNSCAGSGVEPIQSTTLMISRQPSWWLLKFTFSWILTTSPIRVSVTFHPTSASSGYVLVLTGTASAPGST